MAFQQQRNVLAGLGRGIEKALQSAAGFFSKRAEEQYTQGVGAIAWAENEANAIREVMANENVVIDPEMRASLNQNLAYFESVMGATPQEALRLRQQGAPGGVSIRDVTRNLQAKANAFSSAQNVETGLPTDEESAQRRERPTETTRTISQVPFAEMLAGLQRQAALGQRAYNESQLQQERDFVVGRDEAGREHEIRLADLNNLAALDRQLKDASSAADRLRLQGELDRELRVLSTRLNISESALQDAYNQNQTRLEASLREAAAEASDTRANEFASVQEARTYAAELRERAGNTSLSDEERQAAVDTLASIRDSGQLGESASLYSDSILANVLRQRDPKAREAALASYQSIINDSTKSEIEIEQAREQVSLLQAQVKLAGQTYQVNEVLKTGEEQRQAIEAYENSVSRLTDVRDFIQGAIDLGLPEQLVRLREEVIAQGQGGSVHPDLAHMTAGVDMRSLNAAIDLAERSRTVGNRQHDLTIAQIDSAQRDLKLGDVAGRMQLVQAVGQSGMSEEDIRNDEGLQAMLASGVITQGDVNAMVGRSALRQVLESETVNGPKIARVLDRLDTEYTQKRPSTPEEFAMAEQGLRASLDELVKLGALDANERDAIATLYARSWANGNALFEADLALNQAQVAAYRAQTAESQARAAQLSQPTPPAPPDFNALKFTYERRFEILGNMFPGCSEVPTQSEAEGQMMAGGTSPDCDEYRAQMDTARAEMDVAMATYYGIAPSSPTQTRLQLLENVEAVRTDFGDAAAEAFSLSFAATQNGYPVTPFVVGVDDPEEWMDRWGHSREELLFNVSPQGISEREAAERQEAISVAQNHPSWPSLIEWRNQARSTVAGAPLGETLAGQVLNAPPMPGGMSEKEWAQTLGLTVPELREALEQSTRAANQAPAGPVAPNPSTLPPALPGASGGGVPVSVISGSVDAALGEIEQMFSGFDSSAFGASFSSPNNNNANRTRVNQLLAELRQQYPGLGIPNRTMLPGEARTELLRIKNRLMEQ